MTNTNEKINTILKLFQKLANGERLYIQDKNLQYELFSNEGEAEEQKLRRYLNEIITNYNHVIATKKEKNYLSGKAVTLYFAPDKNDISSVLNFFLKHNDDLTWVIQMLHESDPSLMHDMEDDARDAIKKELKKDENIFLFESKPFEIFIDKREKIIFADLKTAVKNHEYRTIWSKGMDKPLKDVKCLKIIYSENNWYIAIEKEDKKLKLLRIKFIEKIEYSKDKTNYQPHVIDKYKNYFLGFENPMTLNRPKKIIAKLKMLPNISKYFQDHMKPHFKTQKIITNHDDGSVELSIEYTQPLEILPFIKKWIPHVEILSPANLREQFHRELKEATKINNI